MEKCWHQLCYIQQGNFSYLKPPWGKGISPSSGSCSTIVQLLTWASNSAGAFSRLRTGKGHRIEYMLRLPIPSWIPPGSDPPNPSPFLPLPHLLPPAPAPDLPAAARTLGLYSCCKALYSTLATAHLDMYPPWSC